MARRKQLYLTPMPGSENPFSYACLRSSTPGRAVSGTNGVQSGGFVAAPGWLEAVSATSSPAARLFVQCPFGRISRRDRFRGLALPIGASTVPPVGGTCRWTLGHAGRAWLAILSSREPLRRSDEASRTGRTLDLITQSPEAMPACTISVGRSVSARLPSRTGPDGSPTRCGRICDLGLDGGRPHVDPARVGSGHHRDRRRRHLTGAMLEQDGAPVPSIAPAPPDRSRYPPSRGRVASVAWGVP